VSFRVVIPARYGAHRLPGKPLLSLAGRPMIEHVWRRASESGALEVVVATDDERIAQVARGFGAEVELTAPELASGTDRCAVVAARRGWDDDAIVVNLQGDEPLMPPQLLRQVAALLAGDPAARLATLCTPIVAPEELREPNVVKVVFAEDGGALYFSRAPIPWDRDGVDRASPGNARGAHRHLGIYAYRVGALQQLTALPPCELERVERLEQLRALWSGMRVRIDIAQVLPGPGVDTAADAAKVERLLRARGA
jgi:3-deoxy-manno-octulosonate cytidylyltransferase (CMP-KDO synthetase)